MHCVYKEIQTPAGTLKLVGSDRGLAGILWENDRMSRVAHLDGAVHDAAHPVLVQAATQLGEYFAGTRTVFTLPLDFVGSAFNKRVWLALSAIPYGETRTYGDIARAVGSPRAVRAVGAANGRNPISIVAPCHRVIGANGKLTGFAGGLETKAMLLNLEAKHAARLQWA